MDTRLQLLLLTLGCLAVVRGQQDSHHEQHRVNVSVYYESLCPDSKRFFTQQLYPSLQGNLSAFVNLTLVPYGKTTSKFDVNQYQFECHHGENECHGNKIQACALKLIDGGMNTVDFGFNKVSLGFINCLMDKADKANKEIFPTKDCALYNHVSNLNDIENCANHSDGSLYLAKLGNQTKSAPNSLGHMVFSEEYKKEESDLAELDFINAICSKIQGEKPAVCRKNGAATALPDGAATLLAAAIAGCVFFY